MKRSAIIGAILLAIGVLSQPRAQMVSAEIKNGVGLVMVHLTDYKVIVDGDGSRFFIYSEALAQLQNSPWYIRNASPSTYGAPFRAGFDAATDQNQFNTLLATALAAKGSNSPLNVVVYSNFIWEDNGGGNAYYGTPSSNWLSNCGPNGSEPPISVIRALMVN